MLMYFLSYVHVFLKKKRNVTCLSWITKGDYFDLVFILFCLIIYISRKCFLFLC